VVGRVYSKKQKQANWKKTNVLIIDEVSMMSAKMLNILDMIARKVRTPLVPFGGIQLLLFGDFYQLPPVGDRDDPESCQFAFEYKRWNELIKETIVLKTMFRQTDPLFIKALHQVRVGKLSKSSYKLLCDRVNATLTPPSGVVPTRLLPLRKHVDAINQKHLKSLTTESVKFDIEPYIDSGPSKSEATPTEAKAQMQPSLSTQTIDYEHSYLLSSCLCEKSLELKIGAQVMCVANVDMESTQPICNGSQGLVTGFDGGFPIVRFTNGRVITMKPHSWISDKFPTVGIKQVPLILAWAITIHKSQGATLEFVEIDAGQGVFECGQTYVALSRAKSFQGLRLTAFDYSRIKIDQRVIDFYADKQ
jgi:ATP-dependent DNA helicase PIF1